MDRNNHVYESGRQLLRLTIAFFIMAIAFGLAPYPAGKALANTIFPAQDTSVILSLWLFSGAYFILVGRHLRRASFALLALFVLARLYSPIAGIQLALIVDSVVIIGLLLTGGWFVTPNKHIDEPGRIKLRRVTPKNKLKEGSVPNNRGQVFAQSPDDMMHLFDEILEVR